MCIEMDYDDKEAIVIDLNRMTGSSGKSDFVLENKFRVEQKIWRSDGVQ